MSTLAGALAEASNVRAGGRCTLGILLNALDDVDKRALNNALSSDLQGEQIAAVLRGEGHQMKADTVQRHRKKRCSCE